MGGTWTLLVVEPGGASKEALARCTSGWDLAIDAWPMRSGRGNAWVLDLKTVGAVRAGESPPAVSLPESLTAGLSLQLAVAAGVSRALSTRVGVFMLSDGAGMAEVVNFGSGRVEAAQLVGDGTLTTEHGISPSGDDFLDFFSRKLCEFLELEDVDDVELAIWDAKDGEGELGVEPVGALTRGTGAAFRTFTCRVCGAAILPADSFVSERGPVCAACFAR